MLIQNDKILMFCNSPTDHWSLSHLEYNIHSWSMKWFIFPVSKAFQENGQSINKDLISTLKMTCYYQAFKAPIFISIGIQIPSSCKCLSLCMCWGGGEGVSRESTIHSYAFTLSIRRFSFSFLKNYWRQESSLFNKNYWRVRLPLL